MNNHQYMLIAIMAAVVIALRSVPFVLFAGKTRVPAWLLYLGKVLTAAAIAMLVVYSLFGNLDYFHTHYARIIPALLASAVTVLLHWFMKNPLISIIVGTVCYMLLIKL